MTEYTHSYRGGCQCGAVRMVYRCHDALSAQVARSCQCEFCLPRSASYLSDAKGELEVQVKDPRYLYAHRFGTNTADFIHCVVCNTEVYVTSDIDGRRYGLVRSAALDDCEAPCECDEISHGGESLGQRLLRRAQSWIPDVRLVQVHAD